MKSNSIVKMKSNSIVKKIEASKEAIGKERDKLRAIVEEYETLLYSCEFAMENIDSAIDELSQYV